MLNQSLSRNRKSFEVLMKALMLLSVGLTAALVLFLLIYVLGQGVPNITWELLSTKPSYVTERIGILPDILNTVYIVLATLLIVLPLGVGAAIYMTEYASNKKVVGIIELAQGYPRMSHSVLSGRTMLPHHTGLSHYIPHNTTRLMVLIMVLEQVNKVRLPLININCIYDIDWRKKQ